MRLIILAILFFLAYRAVRSWMLKNVDRSERVDRQATGEIDDVMIKDPYCEAYFPRRSGVHLRQDGQDLYFCSAECRDKFVESQDAKT